VSAAGAVVDPQLRQLGCHYRVRMDRAGGPLLTPSGTVTFLFTDIEGSTPLWDSFADAMGAALARHDEILRSAIDANDGHVFSTAGDGVGAVFGRAGECNRSGVDGAARAVRGGVGGWPGVAGEDGCAHR
jgi:class 3 adenylate cyclase